MTTTQNPPSPTTPQQDVDPALLRLFARLKKVRVTGWRSSSQEGVPDERLPVADLDDANVVTSAKTRSVDPDRPRHAVLLDLDVPAWLVPSTTPGHSHLYIDVDVEHGKYLRLLDVLAEAGIIEPGYASVSKERGATSLRLPWVRKEDEQSAAPDPATLQL